MCARWHRGYAYGRLTEDENEKVLDNIAKKFRKTLLINLLTS